MCVGNLNGTIEIQTFSVKINMLIVYDTSTHYTLQYGDSLGSTAEENCVFNLNLLAVCHQQQLQQNLSVLNWGCWLTPFDLFNG